MDIPEVDEEWFKRAKLRHPDYRAAVREARARGIAVQPLSDRQVSQAQRRLNILYSEPGELVWRIVDVGSKVFVFLMVVAASIVVGWRYGPLFSWLFE